jgi:hypothetical protein
MGLAALELFQGIDIIPFISSVFIESLSRPMRETLGPVIIPIIKTKIIGELPPDDQLLEESRPVYSRSIRFSNLESHPLGR